MYLFYLNPIGRVGSSPLSSSEQKISYGAYKKASTGITIRHQVNNWSISLLVHDGARSQLPPLRHHRRLLPVRLPQHQGGQETKTTETHVCEHSERVWESPYYGAVGSIWYDWWLCRCCIVFVAMWWHPWKSTLLSGRLSECAGGNVGDAQLCLESKLCLEIARHQIQRNGSKRWWNPIAPHVIFKSAFYHLPLPNAVQLTVDNKTFFFPQMSQFWELVSPNGSPVSCQDWSRMKLHFLIKSFSQSP